MATRTITFVVRDTTDPLNIILMNVVTLLVSLANGSPVDQDDTDVNGEIQMSLDDGDYIVTLKELDWAFTENNTELEVTEDDIVYIEGRYFDPSFDAEQFFVAGDLCTLTLILCDQQGAPVKDREVYMRFTGGVLVKDTAGGVPIGIVGTEITLTTDWNGYASIGKSGTTFTLLRGQEVEVAIQGTGITRRVTVPDSATANMMALVNSATDIFDLLQAAPTVLVRDSLP